MIGPIRIAIFFLVATLAVPEAPVAQEQPYFKGKRIRLIVGAAPGGLYDVYGRLVAQYLAQHIPGAPSIVVENLDGASGIRVANLLASGSLPNDGTVISTTLAGVPTAKIFSPEAAKFEPTKLAWIGSATTDTYVGIVWQGAPVATLEEAKRVPVTMGGQNLGSLSTDLAVIANDIFGFKFKIVTGYKGAQDVKLAMERGELQGTFGTAWGSLKSDVPDWIEQKKIRIITQFGLTKSPDLPDVPLFLDQARTEGERRMLTLLFARTEFSKPFFGPPGLGELQLNLLRRAFDATMRDQGLVDAAKQRRLDIDPRTGEQLADMVEKIAQIPITTAKPIFDAYERFRNR